MIYKALTGIDGYFDTQIVFVDESGPKDQRVKKLAVMDQDGFNVRTLTDGSELVVTPRFSPNSQEITYMSIGQGTPRVYLFNIVDPPEGDCRRIRQHEFCAALFARWPAGDHEFADH